jgi:predicted metal-dependent hydrolase
MAPPAVLRYVVAHELAHLREPNHSARFWRLVESLYGDYAEPRRWLREEAGCLYAH